jgi:hypothetical protein
MSTCVQVKSHLGEQIKTKPDCDGKNGVVASLLAIGLFTASGDLRKTSASFGVCLAVVEVSELCYGSPWS